MNSFLKMLLGQQQNANDREEFGSLEGHAISWEPETAKPGDLVWIRYQGFLKDHGADSVYLHYGFDSWQNGLETIKMDRTDTGDFGARVQAAGNHEINFCFKDSNNNWDNNNGYNWNIHLH